MRQHLMLNLVYTAHYINVFRKLFLDLVTWEEGCRTRVFRDKVWEWAWEDTARWAHRVANQLVIAYKVSSGVTE